MLFGKVHNLLQHHFSRFVNNKKFFSHFSAVYRDGERKSAGFPFFSPRFLIRMNNYLPSITFHTAPLCLHPPRKVLFQPFFPFLRSWTLRNPLGFVSPSTQLKIVINHCQKSERSYTFQALEGLCHWMLNLQPIMLKKFHKTRTEKKAREKSLI